MSKEDKQDKSAINTTINKKEADDKNDQGAPLTESDIALYKRYGKGPYTDSIKKTEDEVKDFNQKITALSGIKESDTGLALPA